MGRWHCRHTASSRLQSHRHSWQKQCRHELEQAVLMSRHSGHTGFSWVLSCAAAGAAWLVLAAEVPGSGVSSLNDILPCKRDKVCLQVPLPKTPQLLVPRGLWWGWNRGVCIPQVSPWDCGSVPPVLLL